MDFLKAIGSAVYNDLGSMALVLGFVSSAALLWIYVDGNRPAEPDLLKAAFSEFGCVKAELGDANANNQVITKSMLEDSLKRCKTLQDQRAAFRQNGGASS